MSTKDYQPLAESLRPQGLADFVGQAHLLAPGRALRESMEAGRLHSMILWGPPGTGKTTLARLMAGSCGARFLMRSAVTSGVKDVRTVVSEAKGHDGETVLFLDEVHRFNKAQQDAFLPHIEDGTLILVGATTENPAFELNNALLSSSYTVPRLLLRMPSLVFSSDEMTPFPFENIKVRACTQAAPTNARA